MERTIKFTYEPKGPGAAYIGLEPDAKSKSQIVLDDESVQGNSGFRGEIIIDLSEEGKIIGIEILGDVIPDSLK